MTKKLGVGWVGYITEKSCWKSNPCWILIAEWCISLVTPKTSTVIWNVHSSELPSIFLSLVVSKTKYIDLRLWWKKLWVIFWWRYCHVSWTLTASPGDHTRFQPSFKFIGCGLESSPLYPQSPVYHIHTPNHTPTKNPFQYIKTLTAPHSWRWIF